MFAIQKRPLAEPPIICVCMTQNFSLAVDTAPVKNCQMRRKNRLWLGDKSATRGVY